jgi:flagellar FliL protein
MAVEAASLETDTEGKAGPDEPASPRGNKRRLILLGAPLLLGLAGAGLWFSGVLPRQLGSGQKGGQASGPPVTFKMPELVANLAGANDVERFVKVDIELVAANQAALASVRQHLPELQDLFLTYLRDMHPSELQSSIGTWRLREELLARAAIAVGPGRITDVLFTNLLIQ